MDMVEKANFIEQTELDLADFMEIRHKAGLNFHDLIRILILQLEYLLVEDEADKEINPRPKKRG